MNFEELFKSQNILKIFDECLRSQGYSGSTDIAKTIFLSLLTRFFDDPVSVVVMGPSGGGKTYALDSALQFIPDDAYVRLEGMSEKALVYNKDLNLKHRFLVIGEAAGMADGDGRALLRQLISEGRVRYATVNSTNNGLVGELHTSLEGPMGLIMTTTATHIHHEDQTRMLVLNLEEDPQRIRESLINQALGKTRKKVNIDFEPWHKMHSHIENSGKDVYIPYAKSIAEVLPTNNYRISRDFPKILALIKSCALLHQFHRDRSVDGSVVANKFDYESIYSLLNYPLSQSIESDTSRPIRDIVDGVRDIMQNKSEERKHTDGFFPGGDQSVGYSDLMELLGRDRATISRNTTEAIRLGYLIDLNPGQGRQAKIVLGDRELSSKLIMPEPEKIVF